MLENKRERLKTFLRKIDEKAIVRIKHFMKESYPVEGSSGVLPAKVKKSRSGSVKKVEARKALSLEAAQLEILQEHKSLTRQVAIRSQTFEVDSRSFESTDDTGAQSSFKKHNKTFHKLFPDIPPSEDLIHAYICALQKEVPYHGRLYITDSHACFYSSVLLKDTKVVIPVSCIHMVKKQNTALLVPNALSVRTTEGDKYLFVSVRNREACYRLLRSVCTQLEEGSTNSSPVFSSAENSFDRCKLVDSSQSSLDSFDQCDGSDLQTGKDESVHREPVSDRSSSIFQSHQMQRSDSSSSETLSVSGGSWVWNVTGKAKSLLVHRECSTLNTLLVIYLILVVLLLLSSGYIGLRIVALEEQLTSLGALSEFNLQREYHQDT
ncbi:GRAM domain-containing protein 2B isoform X2 [Thalassophryne amazonica]|uniref:GRAM domain-containing protein 2B isoform X2 n=1 Tax=Thalassophryne amazonica TaxID=390379 RepID=UPI001470DCCD|nr:GRAM domain-containing protein 2B isoform X2 [Thalassophryne amazonica]